MQFAGHTMGVPNLNIFGAIELFSDLGFDGIEVRCAKDGQIDTETADDAFLSLVIERLEKYRIKPLCLTSYYKDFITGRKDSEIKNLKRVIQIADTLHCPLIRLYGGIDPPPEGFSRAQAWSRTVSGIQKLADYAEPFSIDLCIETHNGSLTFSASDAVRMVEDIGCDNVGILLDFAWVHVFGKETAAEAVELCRPYIKHCHYKDWKISGSGPDAGRKAALMGEGDIPWKEFFIALKNAGYGGSFSDEYERYWHRDALPEAKIGMERNLSYVKSVLENSGQEGK